MAGKRKDEKLDEARIEEMMKHPRELAAAFGRMTASGDLTTILPLTERQNQLLAYIAGYYDMHAMAPTYAEMMRAMGLKSRSNIHNLLKRLEERGHITRQANRERAIVPTQLEDP